MKSLNWYKFDINDLPENFFFSPSALAHALETMDYDGRCLYINSYIDFVISYYLLKKATEAKNEYEWLGIEMHFVNMYQEEWHRNHVRFVQFVYWKSTRWLYEDNGTLYVDPIYKGNVTDDGWVSLKDFEENEPWDYSEPVLPDDLTYPSNKRVK